MIKKFIFGFVLFLLAQGIMAQTTDTIDCDFWWPEDEQVMWGVPEQMPNFPGGETRCLEDWAMVATKRHWRSLKECPSGCQP